MLATGTYAKGKMTGVWKAWFKDGMPNYVFTYKDDLRHGSATQY
jgi:antitoxin component YwqK of YwqJK toxin-antitoxin module